MQVNPNNRVSEPAALPSRPATQLPDPATGPATQFQHTEQLNQALQQTPASRPDRVQYAKTLISDDNYPPLVTIQKIAALLALELPSGAE